MRGEKSTPQRVPGVFKVRRNLDLFDCLGVLAELRVRDAVGRSWERMQSSAEKRQPETFIKKRAD